MKHFIGIDLGTSSLKALLVSERGEMIRQVSKTYPVSIPTPNYSEQSPSLWWNALTLGVKELTENFPKEEICGIGVAGQMHGLVALDKSGAVLRPAILWNDGRSSAETEYLNRAIGKEKLLSLTGNIAFPGFTAPKVLWMKNHEPELFSKIDKILLPKDYLNYKLTGNFCTDYSDAAGTLFLDVKNKCWSKEMAEICGITEEILPTLYESFSLVGALSQAAAEELGLPAGIPVAAGAGDNAAAAVGTSLPERGKCNISIGTSGTVFVPCDTFFRGVVEGIHNFCHANGKYHLMACILSAAACNEWFMKDVLQTDDFFKEQKGITDENLGNNPVYFLPYLCGERSPMNDVDARGVFFGLSRNTKRKDMVLAVLEGVAFAIRENLEEMKKSGVAIDKCSLVGGGARSPLWLKIFANVLNLPVELPKTEQGPGFGGAMLAMVASGAYETVEACAAALLFVRDTVYPSDKIAKRYDGKYNNFKKLYPSLKNLFQEIKE